MARVYAIGAMKGGTAKTATTYNLAYSLAEQGRKVLAIDFDAQSNLTTCFGVENPAKLPLTIGDLMLKVLDEEDLPEKVSYIHERNGVDFIPASLMLSAVDSKLRLEMGTERILGRIIEEVKDDYDYILIDTCPALGALTINALSAADQVIVTVNPQLLAMMGLQDFLKTVGKIRSRINSELRVAGILLTMCETRTILCETIVSQVQETFEGQLRVFDHRIPNTVKVGESIYYSQPLLEYAPESKACKAYQGLAREVITDEG